MKISVYSFWLAATFFCNLVVVETVFAGRTVEEISPSEYQEFGYPDSDAFVSNMTTCVQVETKIRGAGECKDMACIRTKPEWINNNCEENSQAIFFLIMRPDPPEIPASMLAHGKLEEFSNSIRKQCVEDLNKNTNFSYLDVDSVCTCMTSEINKLLPANAVISEKITLEVAERIRFAGSLCTYKNIILKTK